MPTVLAPVSNVPYTGYGVVCLSISAIRFNPLHPAAGYAIRLTSPARSDTEIRMKPLENLTNLGFSKSEMTAYLTLLNNHPVNGSQLSRGSAIPRAKIYDVLRSLKNKGAVTEVGRGLFAPLPPEELFNRLRTRFESSLERFENRIKAASDTSSYEYVWTIKGYDPAVQKARSMIQSARGEVYTRLFPEDGQALSAALRHA